MYKNDVGEQTTMNKSKGVRWLGWSNNFYVGIMSTAILLNVFVTYDSSVNTDFVFHSVFILLVVIMFSQMYFERVWRSEGWKSG